MTELGVPIFFKFYIGTLLMSVCVCVCMRACVCVCVCVCVCGGVWMHACVLLAEMGVYL